MNKPLKGMRILNLVSVRWYNACADYAFHSGRALAALGAHVVFGGIPESPILERAAEAGFAVCGLKRFWTALLPGHKPGRADMVMSHMGPDHSLAALLKIRHGRRLRHIAVRADIRKPRGNWFNRFIYRAATDRLMVPARFMQNHYTHLGIGPEIVQTILPCLDTECFRNAPVRPLSREALGIPDNAFVFGLIARLDPVKGHGVAVEALNRLNAEKRCYCIISGEALDVSVPRLKARLDPAMHDRVCFLPRIDTVQSLIPVIDAGLIPSTGSEAICRIAMEVMAYGKPVVASAINGIAETVHHERGGFLVPPGDAAALARAMRRLSQSPETCRIQGDYNRERMHGELDFTSFCNRLSAFLEAEAS